MKKLILFLLTVFLPIVVVFGQGKSLSEIRTKINNTYWTNGSKIYTDYFKSIPTDSVNDILTQLTYYMEDSISKYTIGSGLTLNSNTIRLGGTLSQNTVITTTGHSLEILNDGPSFGGNRLIFNVDGSIDLTANDEYVTVGPLKVQNPGTVGSPEVAEYMAFLGADSGLGDHRLLRQKISSSLGNPGITQDNFVVFWDNDSSQLSLTSIDSTIAFYDWFSNITSAGRFYGGRIYTSSPDTTVAIAAGGGLVKDNDATIQSMPMTGINQGQGGYLSFVQWDSIPALPLVDSAYNYIFYDYSLDCVNVTTDFYSISFTQDFTLGRAYRNDTVVIARLCGTNAWNFNRRVQLFGEEVLPVVRASGMQVSEVGTRQLEVTSGILWAEMVNRFVTPSKNTSTGDTFFYYYRDGAGGWIAIPASTQIDNVKYDNNTGTLANVTVNQYGVHWVYVVHDGSLHVLYGQASYGTLAAARDADRPTNIPGMLSAYATLVARVIIERDGATIDEIIEEPGILGGGGGGTGGGGITLHNSLNGKQGGDGTNFFHLGQTQYDSLGDMKKNRYDKLNNGNVDVADTALYMAGLVEAHDDLTGLNANTTYQHITTTQETNFETAYTHSQTVTGNPHNVLATQITDFDTEVSNNAAVTANTAKVSNATHSGDVVGSTVLTIQNDAVQMDDLDATGIASSSTYLRGDGTWATVSGASLYNYRILYVDETRGVNGSGAFDDPYNDMDSAIDSLNNAVSGHYVLMLMSDATPSTTLAHSGIYVKIASYFDSQAETISTTVTGFRTTSSFYAAGIRFNQPVLTGSNVSWSLEDCYLGSISYSTPTNTTLFLSSSVMELNGGNSEVNVNLLKGSRLEINSISAVLNNVTVYNSTVNQEYNLTLSGNVTLYGGAMWNKTAGRTLAAVNLYMYGGLTNFDIHNDVNLTITSRAFNVSVSALGIGYAVETPNPADCNFDKNYLMSSIYTQTGIVTFNVSGTLVKGNYYSFYFNGNGTNTISFSTASSKTWRIIGKSNGDTWNGLHSVLITCLDSSATPIFEAIVTPVTDTAP